MNYTSIHVFGHLVSEDILHSIETDNEFLGNSARNFGFETSVSSQIDYAWSSLRNDWRLFNERSHTRDMYGTTLVRKIMCRFLQSLDYNLDLQPTKLELNGRSFDIPYLCNELDKMPIIIVGDKSGDAEIDALDKCTLDIRVKGERSQKSPHATMLDYLNSSDSVYGLVTNGHVLRLIRSTGQLVKLTYIEFDLHRMVEEDHYSEFALLFRLLHASRFHRSGDEACFMERWFNMSVESGNRIRAGLSDAVQKTMEFLGQAVVSGEGSGNEILRSDFLSGALSAKKLNKELIHFIYRILFLFIIEDRNLVYQIPEMNSPDYDKICRSQDIYKKFYAISRLRELSEFPYLQDARYNDLWQGLMDSFRLFEDESFGQPLNIKPLGGVLFNPDTLRYIKNCSVSNKDLLRAFACLNEFVDDKKNRVKINYSALDVEEFGSVYEGILEMRAVVIPAETGSQWVFKFGEGLDRKSSSSYYTRPDLVQNLIRTTLEPVIQERIKKYQTADDKVKDLLSMRVCDAASGSGHIVLAMARTIAWYVSSIRTGEDNPASIDYRNALREVIQKCVYAVDMNPDAVELCKVVLWIEGYCAGKPLSFLDAHIRCGNSVVGVSNIDMLLNGVPNEAFCAENKDVKKKIVDKNKIALKELQNVQKYKSFSAELFKTDYAIEDISKSQIDLAEKVKQIAAMPEDSLSDEVCKKAAWTELKKSEWVKCLRRACDIYTYSFYKNFAKSDVEEVLDSVKNAFVSKEIPYTRTVFQALAEANHLNDENFISLSSVFKDEIAKVAKENRFFHWCIEFPEVFADGGFDVMCGNPPWDKIKIEDKKWFEKAGRMDIVNAGTAAQRKKIIESLKNTDPILFGSYQKSLFLSDATSRFVRFCGRFPNTASGDIDLYPLFAEHLMNCSRDTWGLVLPTGICFNSGTQDFFAKLVDENRLISVFDFVNTEAIFDIHREYRFCLLTAGRNQNEAREVKAAFYLTRLEHLLDQNRIYTLPSKDFIQLNPNTKSCPVFKTSRDAELTKKIYKNSVVLVNYKTNENPWNVRFGRMLDMSNDSDLFLTYKQMIDLGAKLTNNLFELNGKKYVPLYEGKMIFLYNHHYGTWPLEGDRPFAIPSPSLDELKNANSFILPWYWVALSDVKDASKGWKHKWMLGFRDVTTATTERSFTISTIPDAVGVGNSTTLLFEESGTMPGATLQGMMSSLVFDYAARQKLGRLHASIYIVEQLPVITPEQISQSGWQNSIVERVVELCYFNHDLDGWMEELWAEADENLRSAIRERLGKCNGKIYSQPEPFIYDEQRRAEAQAELDAIFAHLYGLSIDDLRYILDPEDVCGKGCINETFRVLKDREMKELKEYRTKRLVMNAWKQFGF